MLKYKFETDDIVFTLEFTSHIMLIRGDSASGKTYFCNLIRNLQSNELTMGKAKASIPLDKTIIVSTPLELKAILTEKGKLIIIDRYDILITDKNRKIITDFINKPDNIFIIACRSKDKGLRVNASSYVSIHREQLGNKIWLRCTCEP